MLRRSLSILVLVSSLYVGVNPVVAQRGPAGLSGRRWDAAPSSRGWAPGELVVQFEPGAKMRRALDGLPESFGARLTERIPLYDVAVVELERGVGVRRGLESLSERPGVRQVSPNYLAELADVPSDPRFDELWGMHNTGQIHPSTFVGRPPRGKPDADIDAPRAWDVEEGSAETIVAVLDTGVDVRHPDLRNSIWTNPGEVAGDGIDNDANGFVDDVHGWDTAEDDKTVLESDTRVIGYQHGTHVAGIIAAQKDNGRGVAGVCPRCSVMPVKIAGATRGGRTRYVRFRLSDELEGIAYAQEMGADVINASFGRSGWSALERSAYARAGRAGILSVVASGNLGMNLDALRRGSLDDPPALGRSPGMSYPAAFDLKTMMVVAASGDDDEFGVFSNGGRDSVDLAAPGVDVLSTVPGNQYQLLSGTSMSAPHVAGAAGLVKSHRPQLAPADLRHVLMNATDKPRNMRLASPLNPGIPTRTFGRLNVAEALAASPRRRYGGTDGDISGARRVRGRATGRLRGPRDLNDVFKRQLSKGDRVVVTLRSRRAPFDLFVWKAGTLEIWQLEEPCYSDPPGAGCALLDWVAGSRSEKSIRFRARRDGHYFFHVGTRNRERGRYTLRVDLR